MGFARTLGKPRPQVHFTAQDVAGQNREFLRTEADAVLIGDIAALEGHFDVIFSTFVLEHGTNPALISTPVLPASIPAEPSSFSARATMPRSISRIPPITSASLPACNWLACLPSAVCGPCSPCGRPSLCVSNPRSSSCRGRLIATRSTGSGLDRETVFAGRGGDPQSDMSIFATLRNRWHPLHRARKWLWFQRMVQRWDPMVPARLAGFQHPIQVRVFAHASLLPAEEALEEGIRQTFECWHKSAAHPPRFWDVGTNVGLFTFTLARRVQMQRSFFLNPTRKSRVSAAVDESLEAPLPPLDPRLP
jgi:hypothetical protein